MNKCPKCNKQFSGELHFCPICGYTDKNNSQKESDFYVCPQCNVEYSYKVDHCNCCGYSTFKYKNKIKVLQNELNEHDAEAFSKRDYTEFASKQFQNQVHCPYCNSTNVKRISATKKAASIIGFGILSNKIGKQWHCNSCKSDF